MEMIDLKGKHFERFEQTKNRRPFRRQTRKEIEEANGCFN